MRHRNLFKARPLDLFIVRRASLCFRLITLEDQLKSVLMGRRAALKKSDDCLSLEDKEVVPVPKASPVYHPRMVLPPKHWLSDVWAKLWHYHKHRSLMDPSSILG